MGDVYILYTDTNNLSVVNSGVSMFHLIIINNASISSK